MGLQVRDSIDGYRGGEAIELYPALPIGEHRHHLEWIHSSLTAFDTFIGAISARGGQGDSVPAAGDGIRLLSDGSILVSVGIHL